MTNEEFNQLKNQLAIAFPSIGEWIKQLKHARETMSVWHKCLEPYRFDECLAVVDDWSNGILPPPKAYERDQIHLMIRAVAEKRRSVAARAELTQKQDREDNRKRSPLSPMAPVLAQAMRMKATGASADELQAYVDSQCPKSAPHEGPRLYCKTCQDRGTVQVWRADVAKAVDVGELEVDRAQGHYMIACNCEAGEHYTRPNSHWKPLPVYSDDKFCLFTGRSLEIERQRLVKWLDAQFESMKHPEFAEYAS